MKKTIAFTLLLVSATALAACGRQSTPSMMNTSRPQLVSETALQQVPVAEVTDGYIYNLVENYKRYGVDTLQLSLAYDPVSKTANFTSYHRDPFGEDAQRSLADVFRRLHGRGVKLMLSNSDTPLIQELYSPYTIEVVMARRQVNSRADRRGEVREVLVRNF